MNVIGDRLKEAMADRGIDQGTLARLIGVTQGTISLIIHGKTQHSKHLPDLAIELGVDYDWLIGRSENKIPMYEEVETRVTRSDLEFLQHINSMPLIEQHGLRAIVARYNSVRPLPDEDALTEMFEALLMGMNREKPLVEQARMLARNLPIALSQMQDVLPPRATADQDEAATAPARPTPEAVSS